MARSDYLARRFTQDKLSTRLSEYKTDKGTWALQWGARGFTPAIDRGTVPSITHFRNADHARVTHAYGEMRETGASFRLLPEARTTALELKFYPFGSLNSDGLHDQYWANGSGFPDANLRELIEVGSFGTLSFVTDGYKPNALCAPLDGWIYHVRASSPEHGFPQDLHLQVFRPQGHKRQLLATATGEDPDPDQIADAGDFSSATATEEDAHSDQTLDEEDEGSATASELLGDGDENAGVEAAMAATAAEDSAGDILDFLLGSVTLSDGSVDGDESEVSEIANEGRKPSSLKVYLSPEIPDVTGRMLVNTAKRMIDGQGPGFDEIRAYITCLEFPASDSARLENLMPELTYEQSEDTSVISQSFNKEQQQAKRELFSSTRPFLSNQGPPGTGKSWWTARMIAMLKMLSIPLLATAPSNVATDAIAANILDLDTQYGTCVHPIRYAGDGFEVNQIVWFWNTFHGKPNKRATDLEDLTVQETCYSPTSILSASPGKADVTLYEEAKPAYTAGSWRKPESSSTENSRPRIPNP